MTTIMYVSAILAVVIILTIIGVLSRYRRCKPNQVLVVYGKTGGEKKSAKLYHGGAAFVLPIIQSYDVLSMEPMQIDCKLMPRPRRSNAGLRLRQQHIWQKLRQRQKLFR